MLPWAWTFMGQIQPQGLYVADLWSRIKPRSSGCHHSICETHWYHVSRPPLMLDHVTIADYYPIVVTSLAQYQKSALNLKVTHLLMNYVGIILIRSDGFSGFSVCFVKQVRKLQIKKAS